MRSARRSRKLAAWSEQPPASSVNLEFEFGATPIQGFLRAPDGSRTWFWGWLELLALLTTITERQTEPNRNRVT